MSKAKTVEECREEMLSHMHSLVEYWSTVPRETVKEQMDGLAFFYFSYAGWLC